ncbi:MAG TPA: asparagine synthase-related protein, partial [Bacteroidia bacterium]|nr:asparagine synthase-related protein [Bacteroidia bacterium]
RLLTHEYLPSTLMERDKMGFRVPVELWMRNEMKTLLSDVLDERSLNRHGLFDSKQVLKMKNHYLRNGMEDFSRLWKFFAFQQWYLKWM